MDSYTPQQTTDDGHFSQEFHSQNHPIPRKTGWPSPAFSASAPSGCFLPRLNTSTIQLSNNSSPIHTPGIWTNGTSSPFSLTPHPSELSESSLAASLPSHSAAPSESNTPSGNKGPGLIRRLSRGAANRFGRRSSVPHEQRDRSSGPVIMRRRSDSKPPSVDSSYEGEDECENLLTAMNSAEGNGVPNDTRMASTPLIGGAASKVDPILLRGTVLTKVSKSKRKLKTFFLDLDSAKVYWDPLSASKCVYIDDIKEIHVGSNAQNYREEQKVPDEYEHLWVSIVFANPVKSKSIPFKTLHLIAPNETIFRLWTTTLDQISRYRIGLMAGLAGSSQSETTLKALLKREIARRFPTSPEPESETLDLPAVKDLCKSLHVNCPKTTLQSHFNEADVDKKGRLNFGQFQAFLHRLKDRRDIKQIYESIAEDPDKGMTIQEFSHFLVETQKESLDNVPNDYLVPVFEKNVRRANSRSRSRPGTKSPRPAPGRMSLDAFSGFLISSQNSITSPPIEPPKFDRPLNEYFISSSHNTYLLGRQVAGASSTEAYISALQKGCRCVEIDCWDGADGRPIVSHGRTMTTSVPFSDCVTIINRFAFHASQYPLILSLEVHCNAEQQVVMANIMKETFGEKLVLYPVSPGSTKLPSPDALSYRILVKVKTCDEDEESFSPASMSNTPNGGSPFMTASILEDEMTLSPSNSTLDLNTVPQALSKRSPTDTSLSSTSEEDAELSRITTVTAKPIRKKQKSRIVKSLSDLGVYTCGYKWRGFSSPESRKYNHVYSFAERSFENICRDTNNKLLFEAHNRKYLTRVYPSQFRLRSSNFDPNLFWRRGVQMVALNWQTYDVGMQLNQAMFAAGHDRTGYVLKPEYMRRPAPGKLDRKLVKFSVDVISAQQLPRSRGMGPDSTVSPYVEIELFSADDKRQSVTYGEGGVNASAARNGMSGIGLPHRRRTRVVANNGYNPIFNDKFRLSLETKYPDLVFVRWVVWSSPDGRNFSANNCVQLATFTAKLSSLKQGYRYLPLYDDNGDKFLFSTLFCKITRYESAPVYRQCDLDDTKIERAGIFGRLGQTVFKRAMSAERDREREREAMKAWTDSPEMIYSTSTNSTWHSLT